MTRKQSKTTKQANAQRATERAAAIRREQEIKERRRRTLTVSVVVVGVLALILAIGYAVQSSRDTSGQAAAVPRGVVDTYALPVGDSGAPVKVTVYEDFLCPVCREFEAGSRAMLTKYVDRGDVQVRNHMVAFLTDSSSPPGYSARAANALGVVLDTSGPGVAKKFHDLLYANQPPEGSSGLSSGQLVDLAVRAGASRAQVTGPINSQKFRQWVTNATDAASKANVTATPTVSVDGQRVTGTSIGQLIANLQTTIASKLAG